MFQLKFIRKSKIRIATSVETYEGRNKLFITRLFFLCQASEILSTSCLSLRLQSSGIYRSVDVWKS